MKKSSKNMIFYSCFISYFFSCFVFVHAAIIPDKKSMCSWEIRQIRSKANLGSVPQANELKVLSYNVYDLNHSNIDPRLGTIRKQILESEASIIFLQEVIEISAIEKLIKQALADHYFIFDTSSATNKKRLSDNSSRITHKNVILVDKRLKWSLDYAGVISELYNHRQGKKGLERDVPFIILKSQDRHIKVGLVNLHLKSSARISRSQGLIIRDLEMEIISRHMIELSQEQKIDNWIVGGDFNFDLRGSEHLLENLTKPWQLKDILSYLPESERSTYVSKNHDSQLDGIFYGGPHLQSEALGVRPNYGETDHHLVFGEFRLIDP